jgi:hypothetical protein
MSPPHLFAGLPERTCGSFLPVCPSGRVGKSAAALDQGNSLFSRPARADVWGRGLSEIASPYPTNAFLATEK